LKWFGGFCGVLIIIVVVALVSDYKMEQTFLAGAFRTSLPVSIWASVLTLRTADPVAYVAQHVSFYRPALEHSPAVRKGLIVWSEVWRF
jgi:hypothetical protein